MPRRISRRRLIVAVVLVVLAVLPQAVRVFGAIYRDFPTEPERAVIHVTFPGRTWLLNATAELAKSARYWWEQYRQLWWVPALVAVCVVFCENLPVPRILGPDDG
jgi:hypothetical protein